MQDWVLVGFGGKGERWEIDLILIIAFKEDSF
jgi:hypothetical protein